MPTYRIWIICTKEEDRDEEIENLRRILSRNDYPEEIINKEVTEYLQQKRS